MDIGWGRNEKKCHQEDLERWMQTKRQVSGGRNKKTEAGGAAEGESKAVPQMGVYGALLKLHLFTAQRGHVPLVTVDVNLQRGFLLSAKGSLLDPV